MPLLSQEELNRLHQTTIEVDPHYSNRQTLLAAINTNYAAVLPHASNPSTQLLSDLGQMNRDGSIRDGSCPLEQWLTQSELLHSTRVQAADFQAARQKVRDALQQALKGAPPHAPSSTQASSSASPSQILRQLRQALIDVSSDPAVIVLMLDDAGIPRGRVATSGTAETIWYSVLDEAKNSGKVAELLRVAFERYPNHPLLKKVAPGVFAAFPDLTSNQAHRGIRVVRLPAS